MSPASRNGVFKFPFQTIEDIDVYDASQQTIVVGNVSNGDVHAHESFWLAQTNPCPRPQHRQHHHQLKTPTTPPTYQLLCCVLTGQQLPVLHGPHPGQGRQQRGYLAGGAGLLHRRPGLRARLKPC